jgi:predicted O-methyltransferase YrrM
MAGLKSAKERMRKIFRIGMAGFLGIFLVLAFFGHLQAAEKEKAVVDEKVKKFLGKMKQQWRDLNVPEEDGKILFEIVAKNRYQRALEVGTSTGHSAIWIAWALSKTGGKLITIEIDEERHRQALANFREAGLNEYIDARLADAHQLVRELPGTFDFVFIDADKEYYPNYAKALVSKIEPGGCLTAHNVDDPGPVLRGGYNGGTAEYYRYLKSLPGFETRIHPQSRYGIAVSYKKKQ